MAALVWTGFVAGGRKIIVNGLSVFDFIEAVIARIQHGLDFVGGP